MCAGWATSRYLNSFIQDESEAESSQVNKVDNPQTEKYHLLLTTLRESGVAVIDMNDDKNRGEHVIELIRYLSDYQLIVTGEVICKKSHGIGSAERNGP